MEKSLKSGMNSKIKEEGYIKSQNKIIEVKSDYTFYKEYDKNLAKAQRVLSLGYSFEFRIYEPKGDYTIPELEFTI